MYGPMITFEPGAYHDLRSRSFYQDRIAVLRFKDRLVVGSFVTEDRSLLGHEIKMSRNKIIKSYINDLIPNDRIDNLGERDLFGSGPVEMARRVRSSQSVRHHRYRRHPRARVWALHQRTRLYHSVNDILHPPSRFRCTALLLRFRSPARDAVL